MLKKRLYRMVSFILSITVLSCAFCFSASALSQADLLTQSQYHYQNVGGYLPDTAPYPDGAFVEVYNPSNGYYVLYNFERQFDYYFGAVDTNGEIIDTYAPFRWDMGVTTNGSISIYSSQPIYYFRGRLASNGWEQVGSQYDSNIVQSHAYVNGVLTPLSSSMSHQHFLTTISLSSYPTVIATVPMLVVSSNRIAYRISNSEHTYKLAPMVTTDYLSSVADFETANKLYSVYSELQALNVDSDTALTRLSSILASLNTVKSTTSEYLPIIEDLYHTLDNFYMEFSQYSSDDIALQEQIEVDLCEVIDKLDTLIENYDSYDNDSVFGSDESGFSDVASDYDFAGTGIDSVISSLGNSFNLLKVNFEYICNFFGLNEVIVLLLGFSVICFVLGRAVRNRMRD